MTGKLIEIGDLEHLQGEQEPNKSGVVILVEREQIKKSPNLFGQTVFVGKSAPIVKSYAKPKQEVLDALACIVNRANHNKSKFVEAFEKDPAGAIKWLATDVSILWQAKSDAERFIEYIPKVKDIDWETYQQMQVYRLLCLFAEFSPPFGSQEQHSFLSAQRMIFEAFSEP